MKRVAQRPNPPPSSTHSQYSNSPMSRSELVPEVLLLRIVAMLTAMVLKVSGSGSGSGHLRALGSGSNPFENTP